MRRFRFILVGAVAGLAWSAALRGYMMQLAGPASVFTFGGTFGIILPAGTSVGALLGWAEFQRRAGHQHWLLIAAPLLLAVLPCLLTASFDSAPVVLALIAMIYSVWRPSDLAPILTSTIRESTMLMMIIGMSLLYSYVMSYLHISQSAAESVVAMHLPRWELLAAILVMVVVLGFFLPPVSIILMTAPIILPPLRAANFDIIWFGVVMTIVMEMGLIHPPVGLNIFVIRNVAPDIPLSEVIWGTLPFVLLMMLAVLILCFVPEISTWLPNQIMGPDGSR